MTGHKQEVCGLKWSFDQQQLASGGNDNRLNIWSQHSNILVMFIQLPKVTNNSVDRTLSFYNSNSNVCGVENKHFNVIYRYQINKRKFRPTLNLQKKGKLLKFA